MGTNYFDFISAKGDGRQGRQNNPKRGGIKKDEESTTLPSHGEKSITGQNNFILPA